MTAAVIPDPWDFYKTPFGSYVRVLDAATGALLEHAKVVDRAAGTVSFERFNGDLGDCGSYEIKVVKREVRLEVAAVLPKEARAFFYPEKPT